MKARVSFLDVGQGDCTIAIDLESRESVVLDCPAQALDELNSVMDKADVVRPTVVVLSHSDTDHMAGAVTLVRTVGDDCSTRTLTCGPMSFAFRIMERPWKAAQSRGTLSWRLCARRPSSSPWRQGTHTGTRPWTLSWRFNGMPR